MPARRRNNLSPFHSRWIILTGSMVSAIVVLFSGYCLWHYSTPILNRPEHVQKVVVSPMSPVKNQGRTQFCWAYSMLAAIETEHFRQGDSLDLSIRPVAEVQYSEVDMPTSGRAMGQTLLNLVERHGIYQEVCSSNDFLPLCTTRRKPYNQWIVPDLPDNWEHNQFFNCHPDSLLAFAIRAASAHRGVCWEGDISERGFSFQQGIAVTTLPPLLLYCKSLLRPPTDDHCMAIVGIVQGDDGTRYFVMKNSWGTGNPYGGLMLMSFDYFRWNTVAVYLPQEICPYLIMANS